KSLASEDKRLHIIKLTEKGQKEFASLNEHSDQLISRLIEKLSEEECQELLSITERIRHLLSRD
ncbi:MAG TPA: hypothetical protein VJ248_02620, partial [Candidatus Udaeobacter sp.]|nr:hypothetical protein [Candidatus Udaeobacter sp.]